MFAQGYVRSESPGAGRSCIRAFAREPARTARQVPWPTSSERSRSAFGERLPDRYRWDYIEALVICRKAEGTEPNRTRPSD